MQNSYYCTSIHSAIRKNSKFPSIPVNKNVQNMFMTMHSDSEYVANNLTKPYVGIVLPFVHFNEGQNFHDIRYRYKISNPALV